MLPELIALVGCAPQARFEAAALEARTPAPVAGETWAADAVVQISRPLLEVVVAGSRPPKTSSRTQPEVDSVALVDPLEPLALDLGLAGRGARNQAMTVQVRMDAELVVARSENGFTIALAPRAAHLVGATGLDDPLGPAETEDLESRLSGLDPFPLVTVGTAVGPIRAARASFAGSTLRIELLTGARGGEPLTVPLAPPPDDGFSVDVSTGSVVELARAEAFRAGRMAEGDLLEPLQLAVEGDRFALDARWWLADRRPRSHHLVGALVPDPAAGFVLRLDEEPEWIPVQRPLQRALATVLPDAGGGARVLTALGGEDGILHVEGRLEPPDPPAPPAPADPSSPTDLRSMPESVGATKMVTPFSAIRYVLMKEGSAPAKELADDIGDFMNEHLRAMRLQPNQPGWAELEARADAVMAEVSASPFAEMETVVKARERYVEALDQYHRARDGSP